MIVHRFYDEKLAQASYLIGCQATGEALLIDANRDADSYLRFAEAEDLRITHLTETHIHADYISGSRELAERTGARLHLSAEGGPEWSYGFAAEYAAVLLRDGDRFSVGKIEIEAVHTPGHTPEHLSFLVTDTAGADRPMGIVTGDFIFVGDVGRPDLLERAAGMAGTMEAGARALFRSLERFRALPDYLQVWPGHGAGSACGKGIGSVPTSTVGYEKRFNWALQIEDEEEFIAAVLAGQPEPPIYFAEMKRINREGPRVLGGFAHPERLEGDRLGELLASGAPVVDTRAAAAYAAGHVPGTINIPLNRSFTTWAGWLLPYDRQFYLILDDSAPERLQEAVRDLAMIGLDRIAGYFGAEVMDAWAEEHGALEVVEQITSAELAARLERGEVGVLDVRGAAEWDSVRLPGGAAGRENRITHIPLGSLRERLDELPREKPLVVHCQGGARAMIAASVLQAAGVKEVSNLVGGLAAWQAEGLPVERGAATEPAGAA